MNRRKALKNIGISFGSITFSTSILSILQSCQSNELDWSPDFFSSKQISFIDRMFEIIIPETDTPGATSLNLSRFVDAYIYKNTPSDSQSELTKEVEELIDVILSNENQKSIHEIDDVMLEKYLTNHLDSNNFTESNNKNYSNNAKTNQVDLILIRPFKILKFILIAFS